MNSSKTDCSLLDKCSLDVRPKRLERPRLFPFAATFLLMMSMWVVFSGKFDALHLGMGAFSSLLVAYFSTDLLFPQDLRVGEAFGIFFRFLLYIPWLLKEIVVANLWLIYLVYHPRLGEKLDPQLVHFTTRLEGRMARLTLANSITLTPGTITSYVTVDGDFTVHAIDEKSALGMQPGIERKVVGVFREDRA